ncbi:TPA: hypothetical protein ACKRFZ_003171 [Proteus mirabilis]|uniref:hypothetical protein n=1 Tax=Proteus sp. G2609 TaxID=2698840 RepID=UPI001F489944|nr:hypothetical protein [Proteus sp. G2609]
MAKNTMNEIYVINLSSNNAVCGVKINEILVADNTKNPKGNYSSGQNISSILTNGKNTLGVIMFNGSVFTGEENLPLICGVKSNLRNYLQMAITP